jgi:toxin ParE1/3/4
VKLCTPSAIAESDVDEAVAFYLTAASFDAAKRFVDAYDEALCHICRFPGTGSRRHTASEVDFDLRFWTLNELPYSVFYRERADDVEIIRVLHQS